MQVSKINAAGDWQLGAGRGGLAKRSEAVEQSVTTRLRSAQGDWYGDIQAYMPWDQLIGARGSIVSVIRQNVIRVVKGTQGVTKILRVDVKFDSRSRAAAISVSVVDVYGAVINIQTSV